MLARDGYEALTISAIAEEALQTKSLVLYHFGRRANLEALLVDSLWHDIDAGFVKSLPRAPDRRGNAHRRPGGVLPGHRRRPAAVAHVLRAAAERHRGRSSEKKPRADLRVVPAGHQRTLPGGHGPPPRAIDELACSVPRHRRRPAAAVAARNLAGRARGRPSRCFANLARRYAQYAQLAPQGPRRRSETGPAEITPWVAWDDSKEHPVQAGAEDPAGGGASA